MTRSDYEEKFPKLKAIGYFVERVGFPVVAFGAMFYMAQCSIGKVTEALDRNTAAMTQLTTLTSEFRHAVQAEHLRMMEVLTYQKVKQ